MQDSQEKSKLRIHPIKRKHKELLGRVHSEQGALFLSAAGGGPRAQGTGGTQRPGACPRHPLVWPAPRPEPAHEAAVTGRRGVGTEYAQFLSYATQRHPIQTPGGSVPPSPLPR